jgi:hypothetical protein
LIRLTREPVSVHTACSKPWELLPKVVDEEIKKDVLWFAS